MKPGTEQEVCALTPMQQGMVLASLRGPRSGAYVIQDVCEFEEEVDVPLLKRAWERVAQRHPALRTRIVRDGAGMLGQFVECEARPDWREEDWRGAPPGERPAEFLREDSERGFDFGAGVPIRFAVIRNGERSWTLIFTVHHALVDGRSLAVVWREWMAVYDGLRQGNEVVLGPAWPFHAPADRTEGAPGAEQYWRPAMEGLTQTTGFIVDRAFRAQGPDGALFRKESLTLAAELTEDTAGLAKRCGVTVNNIVQGAWALLLSRYSGREDVVFGVTRAGRRPGIPGDAEIVGGLVNTLPFRVRVDSDTPVAGWLKQIRQQWVEQREYEHSPIERIAQWSGLPAGMLPFDTVLVYDHEMPDATLRKLGGSWERRTLRRLQRTDSPLTLVAYGGPCVRLEIAYDSRLFGKNLVEGMLRHLENLVAGFVERPDSPLAVVKMVRGTEECRLIDEVNGAGAANLMKACIHDLFEEQARRSPRNVALDSHGETISYAELNERANRTAWFLRERGIAQEDVVPVCLERSPELVIAVLGVLKAGAAFLPLDPGLPVERLERMIAETGAKLVLDRANFDRFQEEIARKPGENPPRFAGPGNAAYVIYTSGSTGEPKAVVVTHASLVNHTLAVRGIYGISEADRRLQFASPASDLFVAEVFNYLCCGAALVFDFDRGALSMREFLRVLDEERITITGLPSTWWHEWVEAMAGGGLPLPRSLRAVIAGMERVSPAAFLQWRRMTAHKIRWFNAYGPTETTCTAMIYEAGSSEWEGESFVPIGKPVANARGYVLDGAGMVVPVGVEGELYIGGEGVARGYLNAPQLTEEKFLRDPFREDPDSRMYRTGDLVFRLPDGNLVFLGRADRQVKIRGYRIELEEVEAVLGEHPGVKHCSVVVDGTSGRERLVAYFTPSGDAAPPRDELKLHLARRLPEHMIPAGFVMLREMPRTASGKIDRQLLPPYEPETLSVTGDVREAATEAERRLAALWREALTVNRAGVFDNFFELGGDSLSATRLIMLIYEHFGKEISLAELLRAPTVARMAIALEGDAGQFTNVVPLQRHGSRLPFFCITTTANGPGCFRRLAAHLGEDQPFLVVPYVVPDAEGLERVEELAEEACRSIREARPQGPYLLGGYCRGGIVAFETARMLMALGEEVRLVALFDAATPGYPRLAPGRTQYWRRLRGWLAGEGIRWRDILAHFETVGRLIRRKALAPYTPRPTRFNVAQFIAREEPVSTQVLEDPRLGWRDLCSGRFTVHHVDGTHESMFHEPHVSGLAERMTELLREANDRDGHPSGR